MAACGWMLLVLCCACLGGWGLADYKVHLFDDYYLLCSPRHTELARLQHDVSSNGTNTFGILCPGVVSYGIHDKMAYGNTADRRFFILNERGDVRMYLRDDVWRDDLAKFGVSEPQLVRPRPPDDADYWLDGMKLSIAGAVGLAIVAAIGVAASRVFFRRHLNGNRPGLGK